MGIIIVEHNEYIPKFRIIRKNNHNIESIKNEVMWKNKKIVY